MNISVIGTGVVGRGLAERLVELGHTVVVGTRDVSATLARTEPDAMGAPAYSQWQQQNPGVTLVDLPNAGAHGDVVINATNGQNSLSALHGVGAEVLAGKVLLDLALPIDLSEGFPPTLTVANTDSLGEQIQRAFPATHVVKSLSSVYYKVMVNPARLPGNHNIFVAGNDAAAKHTVQTLLADFGWPDGSVIDLGDITGSRGVEMYSRLFFTLYNLYGTFEFSINIVRGQ